jgi:hypothetical protein
MSKVTVGSRAKQQLRAAQLLVPAYAHLLQAHQLRAGTKVSCGHRPFWITLSGDSVFPFLPLHVCTLSKPASPKGNTDVTNSTLTVCCLIYSFTSRTRVLPLLSLFSGGGNRVLEMLRNSPVWCSVVAELGLCPGEPDHQAVLLTTEHTASLCRQSKSSGHRGTPWAWN